MPELAREIDKSVFEPNELDGVREVPSPFLPGTKIQFAIDNTSIVAAKKCLRYYHYTIIEGWRRRDESPHLRFGGEFASSLENYHKLRASGLDYEEALDQTIENLLVRCADWKSDHPKKNLDTLLRSVIWYLEGYKDEPVETLILENGDPAVEVSFKIELPWEAALGQPYIYCGHLDRVVRYADDVMVQDQKTSGGGIGPYFFAEFNPHGQMSGYTFAGRVIFNTPIAGVMIDAAQIAVGYTSFARGFTMRTEAQTVEWLEHTKQWTEIIKFAAERDYWPMNDSACNQYGGCAFREVCSQDPSVRQNYLETAFHKKVWNPLLNRN